MALTLFFAIFRYPTEADSVLQGFLSQSKSENEAEWLQDLIMFGESATKFRVSSIFLHAMF